MRKRVSAALIALCVVLYLLASQVFLNRPMEGAEDAEGGRQLVVWGWDDMALDAFREYRLSHPDVELSYVYVDKSEYMHKLKLTVALGEPLPDICILENEYLDELQDMDLFEDLSQPPYGLRREDILETGTASPRPGGGLWGVPALLSTSGVVYDRPLALDLLGTDDPNKVAITFNSWADVISKGMKFKADRPELFLFASLEDAAVMMFGQSGRPYVENGRMVESFRFQNYFRVLTVLRDAGLCGSMSQFSPEWYDSFSDGRQFFYPCSLWLINSRVFHNGRSWGFTLPPSGGFYWGGTTWAIPRDSRNKEVAWDFMRNILLSKAGAVYNKNKENGSFISYKPVYQMEGYQDLILEEFNGQNVGQTYFEKVVPSIQGHENGEYYSVVKEIYLQVVRALMYDGTLDESGAYALFLQRLGERIPGLAADGGETGGIGA